MQQWSSTFIDGSFRFGMKTPMEQKPTPAGCELRFRPVGTPTAKTMEELDEGRGAAICHLLLRKLSQDCFLNLSAMILICSNDAQSTLQHLVSACRFIGRTWAGQQASTCPAQNLPNFPAMAGGLEFIAEETDEGSRLRARRIAYSAKAVTGTKRACISEPKISFCACSAKYDSAWVLEDMEHVAEA